MPPESTEQPRPAVQPSAGMKLGQFRLIRELGRGGVGVVFEAEDLVLHRRVAVKLVPTPPDAAERDRWKREARAVAKLDHPHVVRLLQVGRYTGGHFLVLELMTGGTLEGRIAGGRPLPWGVANRLLAEAASGVAAAHAVGLIHRDLKPANLMLDGSGTVKVADFGLARGGDSTSTTAGKISGTPRYMSPEQCRGEEADERSDVYALGVTYFALLTGRPPFTDPTAVQVMFAHCNRPLPDPRGLRPELPDECVATVRRATEKHPADRFQSVHELLAALRPADDPDETRVHPSATVRNASRDRSSRPVRLGTTRRQWLKAAIVGGMAVPAIAGGVIAWNFGPWRGRHGLGDASRVIQAGGSVSSLAFGPKSDLFAVGLSEGNGGVVVWDLAAGAVRRRLDWGPVNALSFYRKPSPNGADQVELSHLIGGGTRDGPQGWLAEQDAGGPFIGGGGWDGSTIGATATKDGAALGIGYLTGTATGGKVFQYATLGSSLADCVRPDGAGVVAMTYAPSPGDNRLAVVYDDGRLWMFDSRSGNRLDIPILGNGEPISTAGFTPGTQILTVALGNRLCFFTPVDYSDARKPLVLSAGAITALAQTPEGRWLVTGHEDGTMCLVSLGRDAAVEQSWRGHSGRVRSVAVSLDGNWLGSGGADGKACLWNLAEFMRTGRAG